MLSFPEIDIPLVSHLLSSGAYELSYLNLNSVWVFHIFDTVDHAISCFSHHVTKYLTRQLRTGRTYVGSRIEKQ